MSTAGFVAALGSAGAQLANSLVLGAFINSKMGGSWPAPPSEASPHWLVYVFVLILAASGLFFLFSKIKAE